MKKARKEYRDELHLLARRIDVLFGEVENSVQRAVAALVEGDQELARETIAHDDLIDELTVSIEEAVIAVIARQAPVARDLRYLLSVLRVSADLERCGDLALRVAKQVFDPTWISRAEHLRPFISRLGERSLKALMLAAQAWSDRDEEAWVNIEKVDVEVDNQYALILDELRVLEGPHTAEIAVNSLVAAQALERIADHAVCISQRIRFLVTGEPEGLVGEISP